MPKFLSLNDLIQGGKKAIRDSQTEREIRSKQKAEKLLKSLTKKR